MQPPSKGPGKDSKRSVDGDKYFNRWKNQFKEDPSGETTGGDVEARGSGAQGHSH